MIKIGNKQTNNSAGAFILIDGVVMIGECCHSFMKLIGQGHVVNNTDRLLWQNSQVLHDNCS